MAIPSLKGWARTLGLLALGLVAVSGRATAHPRGALRAANRHCAPGAWLALAGSGFEREPSLALALEGVAGRLALGRVAVNSSGSFADSVRVPADAPPGLYRLVARASDGDVAASLDVEVVPAAAASASGTEHGVAMMMPSAQPLPLARAHSPALAAIVVLAILALLVSGVLLLRRPGGSPTDREP